MVKAKIFAFLLLCLFSVHNYAQDTFDAVLFSQTGYVGTARSSAMGNAFGALGGDFTSASINPAGIGVYRSGEFTFSPSMHFANSSSDYLGTNSNAELNTFSIGNLGYVLTSKNSEGGKLVSFSFGVGYNRLKDFNSSKTIVGYNAETSLLDYFSDYANDLNDVNSFDPHFEDLAWQSFVLNEDTDPLVTQGIFYNDFGLYQADNSIDEFGNIVNTKYTQTGVKPHEQIKFVNTTGKISEFVMTFAGNIQHRTYIGLTLGMQTIDYYEDSKFSEYDNNNLSSFLDYYHQYESVAVNGVGVNFKVGAIHRLNKSIRIGAAYHSRNLYAISYNSTKEINSYFDQPVGDADLGFSNSWDASNKLIFDYRLKTPSKLVLSGAYQYRNKVTFSVDYESINYGSIKFDDASYDPYNYTDKNTDNRNHLAATSNIRGGVEFKLNNTISLRGGYEVYGNPWKSSYNDVPNVNSSDVLTVTSFGAGYRKNDYFVDFSLNNIYNKESYAVHPMINNYASNGTNNIASITNNNYKATLTFGFRF